MSGSDTQLTRGFGDMTMPKAVARFARDVINPVTRHFAGRMPPFAIVRHVGRWSGREYRTPIMVFRSPDGLVIALTYGPGTDWVRNVFVAGEATIEYGGRDVAVDAPRLANTAEAQRWLPWPVRIALRVMRVGDFLVVRCGKSTFY
jgi:deazaflavin-dependent oxidoreductase (nitroreductase family)